MASLLSPHRTDSDISLHATVPILERPETTPEPEGFVLSWPIAALLGALAAALCGWILITGLAVVGWLAADTGSLVGAMNVGTQLWLLANGAGARLGSTSVTLIPWGATLVFAFMVSRFAQFAVRQTRGETPGRAVSMISALMAVAYAVPVVGAALFWGQPAQAVRGLVAVVLFVGIAAAWGCCKGLDYDPTKSWPPWCQAIPRAVLSAQLTMVVAGAAALTVALVLHLERVMSLTDALQPGIAGGVALLFAQLAFAPNAIVWSAAYALGAGFTLGQSSLIAPTSTNLGILPGVPLFGALPGAGPADSVQLWWLAAGVIAGGVAAWVVMRARPAARVDETSIVGGLSGLVAGLVFVGLAWASSGNLGTDRLADLGPRLVPLLVMSMTLMGLAGMVVGLLLGLLRRSPS